MTLEQLAEIQRDFLIKNEKLNAVLIAAGFESLKKEITDFLLSNESGSASKELFLIVALIDKLSSFFDVLSVNFSRFVGQAQKSVIETAGESLKSYFKFNKIKFSASIFDPDKEAVQKLIGRTQTGESLQKYFLRMKPEIAEKAKNALIEGFANGDGAGQIAKRINDVSEIGRYNALRLARTETNSAFKSATLDFYKEAKIDKWVWMSSLDTRVCPTCFFLHGRIFKTSKKISTHPNDRCTLVPLLDNQPPIKTGIEIFKTLEKGVQKQLIGNQRFEMFENGDINVESFIGKKHSDEYGEIYYTKPIADLLKGG